MVKEVDSYEKEVIYNEARVQKMRDDGKDPYGKGSVLCLFSALSLSVSTCLYYITILTSSLFSVL
jgi:hypothetical protein